MAVRPYLDQRHADAVERPVRAQREQAHRPRLDPQREPGPGPGDRVGVR
ncbi:hypothetical protein [Saccharothrix lopnurensis]|uniref:Uncharacterized protein n=1 Tax=Saccharothrix lopnurensis TaxID=1670621 RepID=A0ABW1P5H8_9PSEU